MITTTTTTVTVTTTTGMLGEGVFLVALLIVLLSLKEIFDADKNKSFSSFSAAVTYTIVPLISVFFILIGQTIVKTL